MKVWGYVLIGLNFVAAVLFIFLAASVWKARTEWQYALLKQELTNDGLPLEGPATPPDDLEEDSVPFEFESESFRYSILKKAQLQKLIPQGGPVLGTKGGEVIANQTDEVKRVESVVFNDLNKINAPDEKRVRLLIPLVNLATGTQREGEIALLRDYPRIVGQIKILFDADEREKQSFEWKTKRALREQQLSIARRDLAYLGKTEKQMSALQALNAVEEANKAFAPNVSPEDKQRYLKNFRQAIIAWARGQVWYAVPPPPSAKPGEKAPPESTDKRDADRLNTALAALDTVMRSDNPDPAQVEAAKKRLLDLLEGDGSIQRPTAKIMVPFIAEVGANLLDSEEKVAAAKQKLIELLDLGAASETEKKSLAAIADLIVPPKSEGAAAEAQRAEGLVDTAASELLRSYFEEAVARPSTDLPPDPAQARSKLASAKIVDDPGAKRRAIAHLLYHLDAHVSAAGPGRAAWYNFFVLGDPKAATSAEAFHLNATDEERRIARVAWQQRVAAVIGLESYVNTAEAQATQFDEMARRLRSRIADEQGDFLTRYQSIVSQARDLAGQRAIALDDVKEKQRLRDDYQTQVANREAEKEALIKELKSVIDKTKTSLASLDAKVNELFEITRRLGDLQDELVKLRNEINDRERSVRK